jgi:hypothetical protein
MDVDFYNKWTIIFMKRFMSDFQVSVLDAAAVFGNAGHESNGYQSLQEKKPVVPGSKGGYGIMQWTGPRRRDFEAYCKRSGKNPSDMSANYAFLFVELKGPEGKVLPKLKAAKTLEEKTSVFMKTFLRPGIPHLDSRQIWAKRAYEAYQSAKKDSAVPTAPEPPKAIPEAPVSQGEAPKKSILELIIEIISKLFGK